ncbi:MAG: class I SAM-dependent methyltransferase [Candidatus Paceibacterota bacterium]
MISVVYILIALALLLFLVGLVVYAGEALIRGHSLPTSKRATAELIRLIKIYTSKGGRIYDLGCAQGILSLRLKRACGDREVIGVDMSGVRIFFARLRALLFRRDAHFLREDIFNLDLSDADVIYTYLWYDLMPPLEKKLKRELKKGAVIITNTSHFSEWEPVEIIKTYHKESDLPDHDTLFVYVKG